MNRTKKLMTTVTTSLFLAGTPLGPGVIAPAFAQAASEEDPEVLNAADSILKWLRDAVAWKTEADVLKAFPRLKPAIVDKALQWLIDENSIKRQGGGSKSDPYRYYARTSSGG
jgi:hypothetical protein